MIAEARRRAKELRAPITFEVGEVQALPFPDGTFDVCRAARLLEHLSDAERALTEMVRVSRLGWTDCRLRFRLGHPGMPKDDRDLRLCWNGSYELRSASCRTSSGFGRNRRVGRRLG